MNNRYMKARTLARARHKEQMYGDVPYFFHLEAVSRLATPFGTDAMIIAQLHDVIEDTSTTVEELIADFGFTIADAVNYMSDGKLEDRCARKNEINKCFSGLDETEEAARLALIVKACDRLANVRASKYNSQRHYQMYKSEYAEFRQAVYRQGLCEAIWWELDNLMGFDIISH
ncbi:TPA: phosphohydrolase [Photobacterium damselae]